MFLRFATVVLKDRTNRMLKLARGRTIDNLIKPHQRCGYSDSLFTRIHYFYTAGSRNGLEVVDTGAHTHKKEVVPRKRIFFS